MLFRKTPTSERDKYVYRFNDGTVSVIAERSGAEAWIKSLLYFSERYSQEEIAKMKGVSRNTVNKKI